MRIDASRLSRLLLSLSKPPEKAARKDITHASTAAVTPAAGKRDTNVLRERLKSSLQALRKSGQDFEALAPMVTVQEILRWEFGNQVLEHAQFQTVVQSVSGKLAGDERLGPALRAIIAELSAD